MSDIEFIDGLIAKAKHEKAPDFVKCHLSIKREELISWLQKRSDEWINLDVKESREGKMYASVNNWKPDGKKASSPQREPATTFDDDDIPF